MNAASQRSRAGHPETVPPETSGRFATRHWLSSSWVPLLAVAGVALFSLWNPWDDPDHHHQTRPELLAHHLGHQVNSIWVGISLLMLVVPSVVATLSNMARAKARTPHKPAPSAYSASIWGWRALDAIALDLLIVDELCKRFLPWPRPETEPRMGSGAFPSGHTTFAFLMAYLIWQRYPKLGPLWFGIAALVGWSRIEVHAHYPYQVIAGAIVGSGLGALIMWRRNGVFFPRVLLADPFATSTPTTQPASEPSSLLHA